MMDALTYAVLAFVVVVGLTFLAGGVLLRVVPAIRRDRLAPGRAPAATSGSILRFGNEDAPPWRRTVERIGRQVVPTDAGRLTRYRERLAWAGYHDPRAITLFWGAKLCLALLGLFFYPLLGALMQRLLPNSLLISLIGFGVGFFLPDFWLHNRIRARQREVVNMLPDVLDLLMVCVEAGLGFDAAVSRVAEQPELSQSPLHQEMLRMHLEIRAGRPREEALRAFGARCGVQEVKSMVSAFIQADRLGTPLGKTLRVHAESARIQRRHRAEERAHLAPLKMIFPTVLFLMPAFFLVAMAPALLSLVAAFRSLAQ